MYIHGLGELLEGYFVYSGFAAAGLVVGEGVSGVSRGYLESMGLESRTAELLTAGITFATGFAMITLLPEIVPYGSDIVKYIGIGVGAYGIYRFVNALFQNKTTE